MRFNRFSMNTAYSEYSYFLRKTLHKYVTLIQVLQIASFFLITQTTGWYKYATSHRLHNAYHHMVRCHTAYQHDCMITWPPNMITWPPSMITCPPPPPPSMIIQFATIQFTTIMSSIYISQYGPASCPNDGLHRDCHTWWCWDTNDPRRQTPVSDACIRRVTPSSCVCVCEAVDFAPISYCSRVHDLLDSLHCPIPF